MEIENYNDYRDYLRDVLAQRQNKNKNYSLRAMALQLDVAPSMLSSVLNGKRQFSLSKGVALADALNLKPKEKEYFLLLLARQVEKDPQIQMILEDRLRINAPERKIYDLSLEIFRLLSDWYHLAILELTGLKKFAWGFKEVAKKLGITPIQAQSSIELLERLELLEKDKKGQYKKTHLNLLAQSHLPNGALRSFHKQMLAKAKESIESQTPEEKYIGSETLSFDANQLKEFSKLADNFFNQVIKLANKGSNKKDVYHIGLQFFRLTHKDQKTKETK